MNSSIHPDDQFHPPTDDDPYWTETCWFTFAVPERKLSGQLYPFFRPNQGVTSGAAYFWDDSGSAPWNIRYGKNFWHLPLPADADLADISLPNGIRYRCVEPLKKYEIGYDDPDGDDLHVNLTFEAVCEPNYLGGSHLDQPGRYTGTIMLEGEEIEVDAYGFRDRSWGPRSQFGEGLPGGSPRGGYSYGTASSEDAFHVLTMVFEEDNCIPIHGYLLRDGVYSKLTAGNGGRVVLERPADAPTRVRLDAVDELGRPLVAIGECVNKFGIHLNPNIFTWNCLTDWHWGAAEDDLTCQGWGEDHDNWGASTGRRFFSGSGAS